MILWVGAARGEVDGGVHIPYPLTGRRRGRGAEEERERLEEEQVRTKLSVFGRASRYTCRINDSDKFGTNFGR